MSAVYPKQDADRAKIEGATDQHIGIPGEPVVVSLEAGSGSTGLGTTDSPMPVEDYQLHHYMELILEELHEIHALLTIITSA